MTKSYTTVAKVNRASSAKGGSARVDAGLALAD